MYSNEQKQQPQQPLQLQPQLHRHQCTGIGVDGENMVTVVAHAGAAGRVEHDGATIPSLDMEEDHVMVGIGRVRSAKRKSVHAITGKTPILKVCDAKNSFPVES